MSVYRSCISSRLFFLFFFLPPPIVSTGHARASQPVYSSHAPSPPPLGTVHAAPPCQLATPALSCAIPSRHCWGRSCQPIHPAAALCPRITRRFAPSTRPTPVSPTAWADSRSEKASGKEEEKKGGKEPGGGARPGHLKPGNSRGDSLQTA